MNKAAIAQGTAWTSLATLVAKLLFPLIGLYVTRTLGPEINGQFALLTQLVGLADVIRDGGLTQTYLVEKEPTEEDERHFNAASLLTGLIPALLILDATRWAPGFFKADFLRYALPFTALAVACQTLTTMPNARLLRAGRFRESAILNLSVGAGSLFLCVLLVRLGAGVNALLTQLVAGPLVGVIAYRYLVPSYGVSFAWGPIFARLKRSGILIVTNLVNNVFIMSDVFVIQRAIGGPFTGFYNYAQNIGYKPAEAIVFPLSRTLMVAFSQDAGNLPRLRSAYGRAIAATVALVLPIFAFMAVHAEAIVLTLGGPAFLGAAPVLRILSIYLALRALGNISGNTLVPLGHHKWTLIPWVVALAVTGFGVASVLREPAVADHLTGWGPFGVTDVMGIRIEADAPRADALSRIVWWYVAGAATAYGWIVGLAIKFLPPGPEERAKLARSAIALAVSAATSLAFRYVPGPWWAGLAAATLAVPFFHLVVLGTLVERRPLAFLSPRGAKRLWHTL